MFESAMILDAFDKLTEAAHGNAVEKGFWGQAPEECLLCRAVTPTHNVGEKLMLMVTELAEAFEAYRKGTADDPCEKDILVIDMSDYGEARHLTNLEEELADVVIRVLDFCGWKGIDLGRAVLAKMDYNRTRPHMHGKVC